VRYPAGTILLVLVAVSCLMVDRGRPLLQSYEAQPAPVVSARNYWVFLGSGFPETGAHQFSDAQTIRSVIGLTGTPLAPSLNSDPCLDTSLENGSALEVVVKGDEIVDVFRFWMTAGQRLALGIPLHPDRMTREDWKDLQGIGPALAQRIETDRQRNGDFGSLRALKRVRGIGPGRVRAWRKFFQ
jgi:competence protein ComEA